MTSERYSRMPYLSKDYVEGRLRNYLRYHPAPWGSDVDGVAVDVVGAVTDGFNSKYGTNYQVTDFNRWGATEDWVVQTLGVESGEAKALQADLFSDPDLYANAKPMPGALTFFERMHKAGIPLSFITSRLPHLRDATFEWFDYWMPWVDDIHIRHDDSVGGTQFKVDSINKAGINNFFEDDFHTVKTIAEGTSTHVCFLGAYAEDIPEDYYEPGVIPHMGAKSGNRVTMWDVYHGYVVFPYSLISMDSWVEPGPLRTVVPIMD